MSSLPYVQQLSKVIVAQITQTIGWNSIQTTPLELLTDILHKYLEEITRQTQRYTELYGRTEPNLDDVALAFNELNINIPDLEEYISNVDPVPCIINVPRFPIPKESNLNFLKPGSKEVVTRPVHIHEHLPPIFPSEEPTSPPAQPSTQSIDLNENHDATRDNSTNEIQTYMSTNQISEKPTHEINGIIHEECNIIAETTIIDDQSSVQNNINDDNEDENTFKKPIPPLNTSAVKSATATTNGVNSLDKNVIGKPTRDIVSCIMTTSGFISPAREGKLPEPRKPIRIIEEEEEEPEPIVPEIKSEPSPPPPSSSIQNEKKHHHSNKRDNNENKIDDHPDGVDGNKDTAMDDINVIDNSPTKFKTYEVVKSASPLSISPVKKKFKKPQSDEFIPNDPKSLKKQKKLKFLEAGMMAGKPKNDSIKTNLVNKNNLFDSNSFEAQMLGNPMDSASVQMSLKMKKKLLKAESLKKKHKKIRDLAAMPYPPNDNPELQEKQKKKRISKLSKKNLAAMGLNPNAIEGFAIPPTAIDETGSTYDKFESNPYYMQNQAKINDGSMQSKEAMKKLKQSEKLTNEPDKQKIKFLKKLTSTSSSIYNKSIDEANNRSGPSQQQQQQQQFMNAPNDMQPDYHNIHAMPPMKEPINDDIGKYMQQQQQQQQHQQSFGNLDDLSPTKKAKALKKLNKPSKEPKIPKVKKESPTKKPRIPKTIDEEMLRTANDLMQFRGGPPQNPLFMPTMGLLEGINAPGLVPTNPLFQSMRFDFPQSNQSQPNYPFPGLPGLHGFDFANLPRFKRTNESGDMKYEPTIESIPQSKPLCNVAPLMPPSLLGMDMDNPSMNRSNTFTSAQDTTNESRQFEFPSTSASNVNFSKNQSHNNEKRKSFDSPIVIDSEEDDKYRTFEQQQQQQQQSTISPNPDSQQDSFTGEMKRKKVKDKGSSSKKDKKDKEKKKKDKKDKLKRKKEKERLKMASEKLASGSTMSKSFDGLSQQDWSRDTLEQGRGGGSEDMNESTSDATIPKLTLKLPPPSPTARVSRPSTPDFQAIKKSKKKKKQKRALEEESEKSQDEFDDSISSVNRIPDQSAHMKREQSPELARISALITRPPKQKSSSKVDNNTPTSVQRKDYFDDPTSTPLPAISTPSGRGRPKGSTSAMKSGKKLSKASISFADPEPDSSHNIDNQMSMHDVQSNSLHTVDEQTNEEIDQVWICPACGRVDDGTPMIGCDGCDAWYHWICVGIQVAPDQDQDWFCRVCISKKQEDKKKKRKKKDKEKH